MGLTLQGVPLRGPADGQQRQECVGRDPLQSVSGGLPFVALQRTTSNRLEANLGLGKAVGNQSCVLPKGVWAAPATPMRFTGM